MLDGRHIDEETSRQRNVRGDARAFLGNRLLRDLDQYFLTFTQEVGDCRLITLAPRLSPVSTLISSRLAVIALPPFGRSNDNLFRCLDCLRLLYLVVLTVCLRNLSFDRRTGGRLALGRTAASAPTAASRKFSTRRAFSQTRFRVGV